MKEDKTNIAEQLDQNNFVVLRGFIPRKAAISLAEGFVEYCLRAGIKGDSQAPHSPSVYDYKPFVKLLLSKLPELNLMLDKELFPTYTYARMYVKGDDLKKHKDRNACEHSLTLNLYKEKDWTIYMQSPDGSEHGVELEPGDAILYKGCEAVHWRDVYEGNMHVQVFMHYVEVDGPNAWAYFDKKK